MGGDLQDAVMRHVRPAMMLLKKGFKPHQDEIFDEYTQRVLNIALRDHGGISLIHDAGNGQCPNPCGMRLWLWYDTDRGTWALDGLPHTEKPLLQRGKHYGNDQDDDH